VGLVSLVLLRGVAELRALLPVVFHPGFLVAPGVAGCELVLMFWRGTGSWSILVSRHHRSVAAFVWSPSGPLAQRRRKLGQLRLAGESVRRRASMFQRPRSTSTRVPLPRG